MMPEAFDPGILAASSHVSDPLSIVATVAQSLLRVRAREGHGVRRILQIKRHAGHRGSVQGQRASARIHCLSD